MSLVSPVLLTVGQGQVVDRVLEGDVDLVVPDPDDHPGCVVLPILMLLTTLNSDNVATSDGVGGEVATGRTTLKGDDGPTIQTCTQQSLLMFKDHHE